MGTDAMICIYKGTKTRNIILGKCVSEEFVIKSIGLLELNSPQMTIVLNFDSICHRKRGL